MAAATGPPGRPLINPPGLAAAINRTAQRATPAGAVAPVLATSLALLLLLGGGYLETRAIGSHHARKALLHRLQEGGAGGEATHLHSPGGDQTIQFRASDGWARGEYTSTSGDGPNIAAGVAQWRESPPPPPPPPPSRLIGVFFLFATLLSLLLIRILFLRKKQRAEEAPAIISITTAALAFLSDAATGG